MSGEDIKWIEREMTNLKSDMQKGFDRLEALIQELDRGVEESQNSQDDKCSQRREVIYDRLKALELNQIRYFFVGTGIGVLIGSVITIMIQITLSRMAA